MFYEAIGWMKRLSLTCLLSLTLLACGSLGRAAGQGPVGPAYRPSVSPYLNLLRRGDTGLNYYNLVRPQFEFGNSIQRLQQDVTTNQQSLTSLEQGSTIPVTGHAAQFLNHNRYFLNSNAGGAGGEVAVGRASGATTLARPQATRPPARR